MSLGNSTVKDRFGDLLIVDNSGGGLTTSKQALKDGGGTSSVISLSDDQLELKPQNDNGTTLDVKNASNSSVFSVNTSTQIVTAMGNTVNSGCFEFNSLNLSLAANTWTPLPYGNGSLLSSTVDNEMGTSSNPATTFDVSGDSITHAVGTYVYLPHAIVITGVDVFYVGDGGSSDDIEFSLNAFTLNTSGANAGDLSSGEVLYSKSATAYDNSKMYISSLSATTSAVDAAKVLLFMAKQNGTNNDLHAKVYVKYYIKG